MHRSHGFVAGVACLSLVCCVACGGAPGEAVVDSPPPPGSAPPRILVTNDDGYSSEGIAALAEALAEFADVLVVAPYTNESGASQSHRAYKAESVRMYKVAIGDHMAGYAIDGTPTDCVYLGVRIFGVERPFDLVVSGINYGANIGHTYNYSGTVGAAFEALNNGIPGVAVSQTKQRAEYETAAKFAATVVRRVLAQPLEEGVLLSVNVPDGEIACVTAAPPGGPRYETRFPVIGESDGDSIYTSERIWITSPEPGTDLFAIANGCITLTPLKLDRTHTPTLETLAGWAPTLESSLK